MSGPEAATTCQCGGEFVTVQSIFKGACQVCARCGGQLTPSGKYLPPNSGWYTPPIPQAGETMAQAERRGLLRSRERATDKGDWTTVERISKLIDRLTDEAQQADPRRGPGPDERRTKPR